MGRISDEDVIKVREATDIVALISETVPLRQKGRLFWGLCPFHGEKTASFKVDPGTQLWHCFGCSLGGDAFGFLMRVENMDFPDAVRRLAERAHVEITEEAGGVPAGRRERLIAACEAAADFYHRALSSSREAGPSEARAYLKGRGFGSETAKRFRLGYASGGRNGLAAHLGKLGFTRDELVDANLALAEAGGALKDRFFNRIMFPITDLSGKVIAFGGRIMGDGQPKYLNSADTPVFHKSANLYAIATAKGAIVRTGTAVIVEGYTDVIALHEAGIDNAVATLGTALTAQHLKLLGRFAKRIVYLFDGDEAGLRAADRAAEFLDITASREAGSSRVDLAVAVIPEGRDPADHVTAAGVDAMREVIEGAEPLLRFALERRLGAHDTTTPEGRAQALSAAARVLASVRGTLLAQDYVNYLAGRLMTDYETVNRAVNAATPETAARRSEAAEAFEEPVLADEIVAQPARDAQGRAEEELLRAVIAVPSFREKVRDLLEVPDVVTDPVRMRLIAAVITAGDTPAKRLYAAVAVSDPEVAPAISAWLVDTADAESVSSTFMETVSRLKDFALRRLILRYQSSMQTLDPIKDRAEYDELFMKVAKLQREQQALRSGRTAMDDRNA